MKKNLNLYLLLLLQAITIGITFYATFIYFGIAFDAGDNNWTFTRYYLTIYNHEIKFLLLCLLAMVVTIFTKNIIHQIYGRYLLIIINYCIKSIITVTLVSILSSIYTVLNLNTFAAHLPIGIINILLSFVLVFLVFYVLLKECVNVIQFRKNLKLHG